MVDDGWRDARVVAFVYHTLKATYDSTHPTSECALRKCEASVKRFVVIQEELQWQARDWLWPREGVSMHVLPYPNHIHPPAVLWHAVVASLQDRPVDIVDPTADCPERSNP